VADVSGFAGLARTFTGDDGGRARTSLFAALALVALALLVWRWMLRQGVYKFGSRYVLGTLLGIMAIVMAAIAFLNLGDLAQRQTMDLPRDVAFLAPVQQAGNALSVDVANIPETFSVSAFI